MPLLMIVKNAIGAIAMYYLKKNAPELLVDGVIEGLDKLADISDTNYDNEAVDKLRKDREDYIRILRGFL